MERNSASQTNGKTNGHGHLNRASMREKVKEAVIDAAAPAGAVAFITRPALDELVAEILAGCNRALAGQPALDAVARLHSGGKLRAGEVEAIEAVLDAVALRPQYFATIAEQAGALVEQRFDVAACRQDLALRATLVRLRDGLAAALQHADDAVLAVSERVRAPALAAYRVGVEKASRDPALRSAIAPAVTHYGESARARVHNRRAAERKAARTTK